MRANNKAKLFWVNAGFGSGSSELAGGISLSYQTGKHLFSARCVYNMGGAILEPRVEVWDIGALYGKSVKSRYGLASISGGISIVGGGKRSGGLTLFGSDVESKPTTFHTVGLPVEVQLFWTPLSVLGIGIYGFANLNLEKSFVGALLCIQIGKLK